MPALCSNSTFLFENTCDTLAIHSSILDGHEHDLALDAEQIKRPHLCLPPQERAKARAEFSLHPVIFCRCSGVHFLKHISYHLLICLGKTEYIWGSEHILQVCLFVSHNASLERDSFSRRT